MKLITISVPAYNEQESVVKLYETIVEVMELLKINIRLSYYLLMMVVKTIHWK